MRLWLLFGAGMLEAVVGGGGETIWIREGYVTDRALSFAADSEQELIRNTEELLHITDSDGETFHQIHVSAVRQ
jgi:hypothetical protein